MQSLQILKIDILSVMSLYEQNYKVKFLDAVNSLHAVAVLSRR